MKRISVLTIAILMVVPAVTKARSYVSVHYRVRWSPYAFSYKHPSGLVSGDVYYSPYAFGYAHSGLVPGNIRYSPYAFSYNYSGLVADPWSSVYCYLPNRYFPYASHPHSCRPPVVVDCGARHSSYAFTNQDSISADVMKNSYENKLQARRAIIGKLKQDRRKINMLRGKDGKEIICSYLKSKNIDDFKTDRILRIDNKTVSVNFMFRDKNIIVKYWNPKEIQALVKQTGYKRNFYEKYKERSSNFCEQYKKAGGKVYQIESANEKEILAKLMLCPELNDG